ncbi:amidohydrolase family protein [Arthrobacter sp. SX1312]|uniref:amidohydrolase family protein n=1 Tax=Arthrobacter sp. SX1312 TaxID=2058896 RepID=UPI000CE4A572|nr:amidohydrolase family protein [Arthrobacter sp. SX1312]
MAEQRAPIIDVHAHLLPESAWSIPGAQGVVVMTDHSDGVNLGAFPLAVERAALTDPLVMLADMDRAGIDVRVVSPPPYAFPLGAGEDAGAAYSELVTRALVEACSADPVRLLPFGTVPLATPSGAAAAVARLRTLGAVGVALPPIIDGRPIGEGVGRAVLEAADRAGLPVLVHPVQGARSELSTHYLRNLVGNPYETSVAIASCALSGVLDELRQLRILFVHAAGCAPALVGRWDHGWRVRRDVGAGTTRPPSQVLKDRVFLDALAHHPSAAQLAADVFGTGFITLGSDYPFDMGDPDPVRSALLAGLKPEILSRNALRWLGEQPIHAMSVNGTFLIGSPLPERVP